MTKSMLYCAAILCPLHRAIYLWYIYYLQIYLYIIQPPLIVLSYLYLYYILNFHLFHFMPSTNIYIYTLYKHVSDVGSYLLPLILYVDACYTV